MASQRSMLRCALDGVRARLAKPEPRPAPRDSRDLKQAYVDHVEAMKTQLPYEEAMKNAVGGLFEQVGAIETALVRHYGLPADGYLVDVGCGSGRLATPLSPYLRGRYLGVDLVPDLVEYARRTVARPDWRFEVIDHIGIPEADGQADMVCFFSVMTHLLHEQSYWYLEEARRVLKPGGKVLFSFLEFIEPSHWPVFRDAVAAEKEHSKTHLNVFMNRRAIEIWSSHLELEVEDIRGGSEEIVAEGHLGQSLCVLRKP